MELPGDAYLGLAPALKSEQTPSPQRSLTAGPGPANWSLVSQSKPDGSLAQTCPALAEFSELPCPAPHSCLSNEPACGFTGPRLKLS